MAENTKIEWADHGWAPARRVEQLEAQLAEAQRDAERYDYLRKHSTFFDPSQNDTSFLREPPRRIWYHETPHIGADTLDAAIDIARESK